MSATCSKQIHSETVKASNFECSECLTEFWYSPASRNIVLNVAKSLRSWRT